MGALQYTLNLNKVEMGQDQGLDFILTIYVLFTVYKEVD